MCFKSFFIKVLCFIFSINFTFCQVQNIEFKEISAKSDTLQNEFQKYFIDSINSLNIKNDKLNKSKENYNLGLKYFEENNLEKALEYFENSSKIEKIGNDLRSHALSSPLLDAKNFSKNFYNKLHEIYTSH